MTKLLLGQVLAFNASPFDEGPEAAQVYEAVAVEGEKIAAVGSAADLRVRFPEAQVTDYGSGVILPGFVDAHVHYAQTGIIASWGKRLIDWLEGYTFPEETRFSDADYAERIADLYLDTVLAHGTTTVASYCTSHVASVTAFFEAAARRGMRVAAGKTCMDRNVPEDLRDTSQAAYDDSKSLLQAWHGRGRAHYVITPRFAPTSTPDQLQALGALWAEHPDCLMQTHLSEQLEEIAWVRELFPDANDYLDVYESFGLVGPNALYGHAIHLTQRERDRLRESGAALAHCPTSNTFIGSGLFDMSIIENVRVGLATDTGGGSSFSMLRTMAAAYEVQQLRGRALHPAELIWLATEGSARAMGMEDHVGTLAVSSDADLVVLDLASTPSIAQRSARADDIWGALFPTIMMGDDRAVQAVWVAGHPI